MVERGRAAAAAASRACRPYVGAGPELLHLVLLDPAKQASEALQKEAEGGEVAPECGTHLGVWGDRT